jgi:small-conductance mechanosensitive channel
MLRFLRVGDASRAVRHAGVLSVLVLTAAASTGAQQPRRPGGQTPRDTTVSIPTGPETAAPLVRTVPVAPAEIPMAADRGLANATEMLGIAASDAVRAALDGAKPLRDSIAAEERVSVLRDQGLLTRRGLSVLTLSWSDRDRAIAESRRVLQLAAVQLDTAKRELTGELARWEETARAQLALNTRPALVVRANQVVSGLQRILTVVVAREAAILDAEIALSDARERVFAEQQVLVAAQGEARRDLLRRESLPLWQSRVVPASANQIGSELQALREVRWFLTNYTAGLALHGLAILCLMALAYKHRAALAARADTRDAMGQDTPDHAGGRSAMLRQPVASMLLVGLSLTVLLYPRAPISMYDVAIVLAAFPLFVLLPAIVPTELTRVARAGVIALVVQRAVVIATLGTPPYRLGQLALSFAGASLLWYALRTDGASQEDRQGWRRGVRLLVWSVCALFAIATVANIVGNVTLAETINGGVPVSAFVAIMALAVIQIEEIAVIEGLRLGARYSPYLRERGGKVQAILVPGVKLLAGTAWLTLTLQGFDLLVPAMAVGARTIGAQWQFGQVSFSLSRVILFGGMVWAGLLLARLVSGVLELDVLGRMRLRPGSAVTVSSLVRYALITMAFFFAASAIGLKLTDLAIIGGALSVGIGFGLQNVVNNFVSGLLLAFERPVAVGDTVQVGSHSGIIRVIGIRASVLETPDGAEVIVPNSELITKEVINWTRSNTRRRIELPVSVPSGADPADIITMLREVVRDQPTLLRDPAPTYLFQEVSGRARTILVRAWTDEPAWSQVRSDLALAVEAAIRASEPAR